MQLAELARQIYRLRNSDAASQLILAGDSAREHGSGVLLLKPSCGDIPVGSIREILERLVSQFQYAIRSVAWWHGRDLKACQVMSLHYPGFHRVAHGGVHALTPTTREALAARYADFPAVFGMRFALDLVRTPYHLANCGLPFERSNQWWEVDRSHHGSELHRVQRIDEHTLALALTLTNPAEVPAQLWGQTLVLLNGFYAQLEYDFETRGCIALRIQRQPDSGPSWEDLRTRFAGKTNPFQAPPGTVRGDAARGVLPVETVSVLANVIHLSANQAEGQREVEQVWWEPGRLADVFGAAVASP